MTKVPVLHTDGHLGLLDPTTGIIVWQDGMVDSNIPWTIIAEYILRYDKLVAAEFRKLGIEAELVSVCNEYDERGMETMNSLWKEIGIIFLEAAFQKEVGA
jgi:hypothetical protein